MGIHLVSTDLTDNKYIQHPTNVLIYSYGEGRSSLSCQAVLRLPTSSTTTFFMFMLKTINMRFTAAKCPLGY